MTTSVPLVRPDNLHLAGGHSVRAVFESQQTTALRWRLSTVGQRIARIRKLRDAVLAAAPALRIAAAADFRKPEAEVNLTEIFTVVSEANMAIRRLKRWMKPTRVGFSPLMAGTRGSIEYQPRGRCLIIAPWNYPVNLSFCPLVLALAAGNTAIIKPSEMTPNLAAEMQKIIDESFPSDEVAMFQGESDVAQALLDLPFDHIFFTGAPALGKVVMAAAARHLTSVTLELGGKSPTIIDASADLKAAAHNVCWSKFMNNGQTCIAPDHLFVHDSVADEFLDLVRERLAEVFGKDDDARFRSPDLARIVNARHTSRVRRLLDDARARGATVVVGGDVREEHCYVSPTVLEGVPADAAILQEEIFGPLLPVIRFDELDAVIDRINGGDKPLALYVWGKDRARIRRVLDRTSSGGACVNNTVVQALHPLLPFGGVNYSGLGSTHGEFGFRAFSHARAIADTRVGMVHLFFPPYTARVKRIIEMTLRWLT
ncbi:aldehyde dehydrogenase family protein [Nevskia sp.]|uniref:aldehyde dehydrogenase family protein n=1 Tax=Nevskia sp. TaxID=1929292 RepID=UPI0025FB3119|nr:aldehyde dehydrogenase family protein [Nevskia sp.]